MKRRTHNIFSFSIALWLSLKVLKINILYAMFLSLYFAITINWAIDSIAGHKGVRRAPYTHSIFGSIMISIAISVPILLMIYIYENFMAIEMLLNLLAISISIGLSHILLDMFTADGIYPLWPINKARLSLLRVRYDNFVLNVFTIFISIAILITSLITYN